MGKYRGFYTNHAWAGHEFAVPPSAGEDAP
jgi:hypothetical protein